MKIISILISLVITAIGWFHGWLKWIVAKFFKNNANSKSANMNINQDNKTFNQKSGNNSHNIQGENIILI